MIARVLFEIHYKNQPHFHHQYTNLNLEAFDTPNNLIFIKMFYPEYGTMVFFLLHHKFC